MASVTLSSAFDTADFWSGRDGAAIDTTATIYKFKNLAGYWVEVTGTGLTYTGDDPDTGTYATISIYSDSGFTTLVAAYSGGSNSFGTYFSSGAATALSGGDNQSGSSGDDSMTTGAGTNVFDFLYGGDGNDVLAGEGPSASYKYNYLYGETGDDTVIGGSTTVASTTLYSYLYGGDGNDLVSNANAAAANSSVYGYTVNGEAGDDTVVGGSASSSGSYVYNYGIYGGDGNDVVNGGDNSGTYVQNAMYGDSGSPYSSGSGDDTLNGGNNLSSTGTLYNYLYGDGGNDSLTGGSDAGLGGVAYNFLYGDNGDDTLVEGTGGNLYNYLYGGAGNDIFVVSNVSTALYEFAGQGIDELRTQFTVVDLGLAPYANIENVTYTGGAGFTGTGTGDDNAITGGSVGDSLTGNAGDDTLDGAGGADSLYGGTGNDTYIVDDAGDLVDESGGDPGDVDEVRTTLTAFSLVAGVLLLGSIEYLTYTGGSGFTGTGNATDNILTSGAGSDHLDGGVGADTMRGGGNDDVYIIDDAGDVVEELSTGGIDLVQSSVTIAGLWANVENASLTGSAALDITGNALDNELTGNSGDNELFGGAGNDDLSGAGGNDVLLGGAGNDTLNGGTGNDYMQGGTGDDDYVVNSSGDVVVEFAGGGTDIVEASISYTLGANIEDGILLNASAINLTGNGLANSLIGNSAANVIKGMSGNDSIQGGGGRDTLFGNSGSDHFVYGVMSESGASAATRDVIKDFIHLTDKINLSEIDAVAGGADDPFVFIGKAGFHGIAGELRYVQVNAAGTANDRTIIAADVDGNKTTDFSIELTGLKTLTSGDFVL